MSGRRSATAAGGAAAAILAGAGAVLAVVVLTAARAPSALAPPPTGVEAPRSAPDTVRAAVVLRRGWKAMGTLLELTSAAPDSSRAREALSAGRREVLRLDSLLSTYRPASEISRVNRAAGSGEWRRLSAPAAAALREALRWAERTGGVVDPTVGPLLEAWGFRGGGERGSPAPAALDSVRRLVGWSEVETRDGGRRVRLPRAGMWLDFGAVGKGIALERAVEAMQRAGAVGGMADLGGQVSVFGRPPGGEGGWRLGIRHPRGDRRLLGSVSLDSGSVATSGDTEQFFVQDGVRYSHIMDARSGRPARGVAQVTVAAPEGSTADALATALFVLGPDRGMAWLRRHGRLGRGKGRLSLVVWVLDPKGGPVCPDDVVRAGPAAGRVELRWNAACPERTGERREASDGARRHPIRGGG